MTIDLWNKIVWKFIESIYRDGKRFYFTIHPAALVDSELLPEELKTQGQDVVIQAFNDACNDLFIRRANQVSLKPQVWLKNEDGVSLVSCLIAQQIIAAENMEGDAFYPVYIDSIAADHIAQDLRNKLPMDSFLFTKLWGCFKDELNQKLGCQEEQITFREGVGRKEKYRFYPCSQSLFPLNDLEIIARKARSKNIDDVSRLQYLVQSNIRLFTKRSQRKVRNEYLVGFIAQQLKQYIDDEIETELRKRTLEKRKNRSQLAVVYSEDGFCDSYQIFLKRDNKLHALDAAPDMLFDSTSDVLVLTESLPGYWDSTHKQSSELKKYSSFILLVSETLKEKVNQCCSAYSLNPAIVHLVGLGAGIEAYIVHTSPEDAATFKEVLKFFKQSGQNEGSLVFAGGLCVDRRTNAYLCGYPPDQISFGGRVLMSEEIITLNEDQVSVSQALSKIGKSQCNRIYFVRFGSSEASVRIVSEKEEYRELHIGYPISDGVLSLRSISLVDLEQPYFAHLALANFINSFVEDASVLELVKLSHIEVDNWVPLSDNQFNLLVEQIKRAESPHLHSFLFSLLQTRKAPFPLMQKLFKASTL